MADELETAYKGRIWAPELRHVKSQRQGIKAARVEIQTFTGDAKVPLPPTPPHPGLLIPSFLPLACPSQAGPNPHPKPC